MSSRNHGVYYMEVAIHVWNNIKLRLWSCWCKGGFKSSTPVYNSKASPERTFEIIIWMSKSLRSYLPISLLSWKRRNPAKHPYKTARWSRENDAFVPDFGQQWKWKMWKGSFGARCPSKSESWRCKNDAFVRDILQKVKFAIITTKV